MRTLISLISLLLSFSALGADSVWSYKVSPNANGGFDLAFFKDGKDFPLDQTNWPEVSVAMISYAHFLTPDQAKQFNKRIDGTLKQLDGFGWQSVVQTTADGKPRAALFHSPKDGELKAAGDLITNALINVDANRLKQIDDQKAKCLNTQNNGADGLYEILSSIAAMKGCGLKSFSAGDRKDKKCLIDLKSAAASEVSFESVAGARGKIKLATPFEVHLVAQALQEQGYCKISSENYSAMPFVKSTAP